VWVVGARPTRCPVGLHCATGCAAILSISAASVGRDLLRASACCLRPWVLDEVDARPFYKKALELGIRTSRTRTRSLTEARSMRVR
jgi:hypothetical protein